MKKNIPVIALVGRMNVGKSTLFNRISSKVKSMVLDYEGVTRDPITNTVVWKERSFELVDTAGLFASKKQDMSIEGLSQQKALEYVQHADIVLFMVDGVIGLVNQDRFIAQMLHKLGKKVVIVVNKADAKVSEEHVEEFNMLGFDDVQSISAYHGTRVYELFDHVVSLLPISGAITADIDEERPLQVVFLGRPNVGKSSLLNALLNRERAVVSDIAGTTREPLRELITFYQEHIVLIDTPGIRRKSMVDEPIEKLMVHTSLQALKDADIVVLLIDVTEADIVDQELKLAFYAFTEKYKGLIILFNKVDLLTQQQEEDLAVVKDKYDFLLNKIPMLNISAKTGKNIGKVLPLVHEVWLRYARQLPTELLQSVFIQEMQRRPMFKMKQQLQIHQVYQIYTRPITIVVTTTHPEWFGDTQNNFFDKIMREHFDLLGAPIKFIVQKRS